ncbi:MAG: cytochrome c oxidase subunit 3 [Alphaproteobacteria bacterium]|nr:cytochrome c oxidase subunit 3 [Alphaproteobacteria bacterium]
MAQFIDPNATSTEPHHHPFHLVDPSPWPVRSAVALFMTTFGTAFYLHGKMFGLPLLGAGVALLLFCMYGWWRDVVHEGETKTYHTRPVAFGLRIGMGLFILSEVMFFAAFFWAFFNASTEPKMPLADTWAIAPGIWPPKGIEPFDPWHIPFLNTLILLLSGTTVTWAHFAVLENNRKQLVQGLACTVFLGICFTSLQAYEYTHAAFGFKEGVYASTFYMATGFHGFHVIIGTVFLLVCLIRAWKGQFTPQRHLGLEFAAWYWHFVDVVWLFLFVCVYGEFVNKLLKAFSGT